MNVNDLCREHKNRQTEFFEQAFNGYAVPADIRTASERICRAYDITGICDPMYVANVIAKEIGRGDGLSHFV